MIVAVLALDQVMGFELMIPGQVFGMANLAAAEAGAIGADAQGVPGNPPQVELMGGTRMESVDGVTSISDARAHDQDVLRSLVGQRTKGGGIMAVAWLGSIWAPSTYRV